MSHRVLYETHCHTPLCKHATGTPGEYAAAARDASLKGVIITCHCPLPDGLASTVRMRPNQFTEYVEMVAAARRAWQGIVDVRLGLESDYYPGVEPWLEELHARANLHYILGSIHYQLVFYRDLYFTGNLFDYQRLYFEHLARAAESGLFDALAHPDLIKNEDPQHWDFERLRPTIIEALDRIAATGVAMELNTSGLLKKLPEMNPGLSQLRLMAERGIPVVIGSDAHDPRRVGDHFHEALDALELADYDRVSWFLDRRRHEATLVEARASLSPPSDPW